MEKIYGDADYFNIIELTVTLEVFYWSNLTMCVEWTNMKYFKSYHN